MNLHGYQHRAIEFLADRPHAMLWIDMGLGKTVITLTSLWRRFDRMEVRGALVLAPRRVVESVWRQEVQKWPHLRDLRIVNVIGDPDTRTRRALMPADIYATNYENLRWLADTWTKHFLLKSRYLPVNAVVYDEVSKMKNSTSKRMHAVQRLLPYVDFRIGLTGTPAANGYKDLHGQYLAVDSGARLGQGITEYKRRFLEAENPMSPFGKQKVRSGAAETMHALIGDITVEMKNRDYLELPPVIENEITIQLPEDLRAKYDKLEQEMWLRLDSGREVESFNAASLTNRCLQFAQGAMYPVAGADDFEEIHHEKLYALDEVIEEAAGKPVLTAIAFRHDGHRITKRYPEFVWVDSKMSAKRFNDVLDRWGRGEVPGIVMHPASLGHGVDRLKDGPVDDLVWFGHTWSLDNYQQVIGRLERQGRTRPIRMHHLQMAGTVQDAQRIALATKAETQNDLKAALNEYRGRREVAA